MKLPVGVYAVSQSFEGAETAVDFTFQGVTYQAQPGVNAFCYLEELTDAALQAAQQPFCGYQGIPVVILPAGLYKIGTVRESRFRTQLPCAMAILGENAGVSPNCDDLRTANPARQEETVIQGSFYFGCIALRNGVDGTLILDGLMIRSAKIFDERTQGEALGLTLKNIVFDGSLSYDLVRTFPTEPGCIRTTLMQDCRADGIGSHFGEGRLLGFDAGNATVQRLYFANTDKFPGLTNYSRTVQNRLGTLLLKDCLFEHCKSAHGLSLGLSEDCKADIRLENCDFIDFAPADDPAIWVHLPAGSHLQLTGCHFAGAHDAPAVLVDGSMEDVSVSDTVQQGYTDLYTGKPLRRTVPDEASFYPLADPHSAVQADFSTLDALYDGKKAYYCDFHCHSNSGGTAAGRTPIENYVENMKKLGLDCAAIVDHKQMRHFFLPCWDEQRMICGTEPGTRLEGREGSMDYTMIFPDKTGLAQVMGAFPEFKYTGTWDGHYTYPRFTRERFRELGEYIYSIGGLMSHAHPMQLPGSGAPEDYFFSEQMAFETVHADVNAYATRQNHSLWLQLLAAGKRLRTHGSSDSHGPVSNRGLTTVYAEKHCSTDIFNLVRSGNCTAGGVGIRMSIGQCPMGSVTEYADGLTLCIRVDDFHFAHWQPETVYSLKVYTDKGLAYAVEFDGKTPIRAALPVKNRAFYRCEVWNESDNLPVAFSNPIWLD